MKLYCDGNFMLSTVKYAHFAHSVLFRSALLLQGSRPAWQTIHRFVSLPEVSTKICTNTSASHISSPPIVSSKGNLKTRVFLSKTESHCHLPGLMHVF